MEASLGKRKPLDKTISEKLLARLRDLGLSSYAAKAYVTLLSEPGISAGQVCKATGIPDSKIYYALEELVRRRLVIAQHGNPTLFRPVDAKQAIESLKNDARTVFDRQVANLEEMAKEIEPILSLQEADQEVELAYIVNGKRNILAHMIRTVKEAQHELMLLSSGKELFAGLLPSLQVAQERGVRVKVAVYGNPSESRNLGFTELKASNCDCNLMIADSKRLVTVARHNEENAYAIITGDRNMISLSRSYYDNPACCSLVQIRSGARTRT